MTVATQVIPPLRRREVSLVAGVSVASIALLIALAAHFEALGIARADDWSFIRMLQDFSTSGRIQLTGWVQMTFVGQAVLVLPWLVLGIEPSILALQLITAFLAAGTLLLSYLLARFLLPPILASLAPVSLGTSAVFGSLAVSVMTDIPALFATLLSLVLAAYWLTRGRTGVLIVALVAATWAFSIREYGAVALVAVVGTAWFSRQISRRRLLAVAAVVFIGVLALYTWRSGLPGGTGSSYRINALLDYSLPRAVLALLAIGLSVFPAAAVGSPRAILRYFLSNSRGVALLISWTSITALGVWLISGVFPLGNYLTVYGAYPGIAVGTTSIQVLSRFEIALLLAASAYALWMVGLSLTAGVFRRSTTALTPPATSHVTLLLGLFSVGFLFVSLMTVFFLPFTVDRYLIPLSPILAILVVRNLLEQGSIVRKWGRLISLVAVGAIFVVSYRVVVFSDLVDGMRWSVSREAVAAGLPATQVDGGFDWTGYHYPGLVQDGIPVDQERWWHQLFPGFLPCAEVVVTGDAGEAFEISETRSVIGLPSVTVGIRSTGLCSN